MPTLAPETTVSTPANEIIITRLFDAPRELLFDTWTNPLHIPHWYGPHGFSTTVQEMSVVPGGDWRLTMRGPDGREFRNHIVFSEVDRPSRLVYQHHHEPGSEFATQDVQVTFESRGSQTLLTLRMIFSSVEERDRIERTYHAIEGGNGTLARLAAYAPQVAEASKDERTLTITRTIKAPRELVFAAWTDPVHLAQWWAPKNFNNPVCEADARPGGRWHIVMRGPEGPYSADYPCGGVYELIDPPNRLAFTNNATAPDGSIIIRGFTSVTFAEQPDGTTLLTLQTRGLPLVPEMVKAIAGMDQGWNESLDKLSAHMES
jgi:uncharacterized protein YndB with AHSA1/START domain